MMVNMKPKNSAIKPEIRKPAVYGIKPLIKSTFWTLNKNKPTKKAATKINSAPSVNIFSFIQTLFTFIFPNHLVVKAKVMLKS